MFTGIVTDIGIVQSVEERGDLRLTISCGYDMETVEIGASIACSGVCLTVVDKGDDWFSVDISGETRSKTAAAHWKEGSRLNLERALRLGDELGGHLVTGHVDGTGEVESADPDGDSIAVTIHSPLDIAPFVAPKGSITLDGVSLTVNEVADSEYGTHFSVNIIPHTVNHTTLGTLASGNIVNLEIDVLARYLKRLEEARAQAL